MSSHRLCIRLAMGIIVALIPPPAADASSLPLGFWRDVKASAMRSEVPETRAALATLLADEGFVRDFDGYVRRLRSGRPEAPAHPSLEVPSPTTAQPLSPRGQGIVDDFVSRIRQEISEKSFSDDPWGLARAEWTQGLIVERYREARRRMAAVAPEEAAAWRHLVDYLEEAKAALGRAHKHHKDFSDYMTNVCRPPGPSAPSRRASSERWRPRPSPSAGEAPSERGSSCSEGCS